MTDQQSLDDIKMLLLKYPGVTSALVVRVSDRKEVCIRFRITDVESLRRIAASSAEANVAITLGNPNTSLCGEPQKNMNTDLPCDISIPDTELDIPTHPQRFGVYISADLEKQRLITTDELNQLHARWNTRLAKRRPHH